MALKVARELMQENQELRQDREVFAEEYHRQKRREAVAKSRQKKREKDPQGYLDDQAKYKREYRAKQKRKASESEGETICKLS